MINKIIQRNRGYTLLFAVLVSSLVLSVGISILTISKKEFLLSSSARESTLALYAADSGLECALYHNDNGNKFSFNVPDLGNVLCAGQQYSEGLGPGQIKYENNLDIPPYTVDRFTFHIKFIGNSCALIILEKYSASVGATYVKTSIESRGYNIGWNSTTKTCDSPSPRRVERVLFYDAITDFL